MCNSLFTISIEYQQRYDAFRDVPPVVHSIDNRNHIPYHAQLPMAILRHM
jgi:hypothetical protein